MENQKDERELAFEGEDKSSSGEGSSASANRNNYMAQYEAA